MTRRLLHATKARREDYGDQWPLTVDHVWLRRDLELSDAGPDRIDHHRWLKITPREG